jgi:hypothetical protein
MEIDDFGEVVALRHPEGTTTEVGDPRGPGAVLAVFGLVTVAVVRLMWKRCSS